MKEPILLCGILKAWILLLGLLLFLPLKRYYYYFCNYSEHETMPNAVVHVSFNV